MQSITEKFYANYSELSKQNEIAKKNLEKIQAQLKSTDSELTALKKVQCICTTSS